MLRDALKDLGHHEMQKMAFALMDALYRAGRESALKEAAGAVATIANRYRERKKAHPLFADIGMDLLALESRLRSMAKESVRFGPPEEAP